MLKINVYYWNNGVGVLNHSKLLKNLLSNYNVVCYDMSKNNTFRKSDMGIFIQNVWTNQLENNKQNIYFVCEEWMHKSEIEVVNKFDYIFVNSNYAKSLLDLYHKNVINTGFFSLDRHFFPKNTNEILHFKGKSIQKNTELVNGLNHVKILDSNINYLSDNDVTYNLNNHDIHICCSLYESWGHYLWEAMSCGKLVICSEIPVFKEYLDPNLVKFIPIKDVCSHNINYEFLNTNDYKLRKGYIVDEIKVKELLSNKNELLEFQKKNSENIRQYFLNMNKINKQKFLNMIEYIIYG
jgi:glycosyltransferase involved in cell wall biosynthesis